ncbi:MAG: T9SS type A sorting domain-containing protein [Candidatus Zixiibacteriota bacterium]|nr:MAG: T9SS type A sorting domain-containing protein [candidate division Zixibacteria bacterium]
MYHLNFVSVGRRILLACGLCFILATATLGEKPKLESALPVAASLDNSTYIDAGTILMFVTNHGNFGRDLAGYFGHDYGTYYPFIDDSYILNDQLVTSPLYAAGLWLGGVDEATGDILVAVSKYDSEYAPGPMEYGTYLPDNPYFKVYKLDPTNPDQDWWDYVYYAIDELGAPVDFRGDPLLIGDQTLWTVFNDADPMNHQNDAGSTAPLGIEVQMSVWADEEMRKTSVFNTNSILYHTELAVTQIGTSAYDVFAYAVDPKTVTGDQYRVVFEGAEVEGETTVFWHLENVSSGTRLLSFQPLGQAGEVVEGIAVAVFKAPETRVFSSFEVVANADGSIDPPVSGALASAGFPTPGDSDPDENQQVGDGMWALHAADNGGSCGGGTMDDYSAFAFRVTRSGTNTEAIGRYDFEMRFTGSYSNPGSGGSYAFEAYNDDNVFWVPFELWRTGSNTPDDPSDDIRLVPWIMDHYGDWRQGNNQYGLESWGCILDITGSGDGEHSASDGDDDPWTDWVYWRMPTDSTPGESGYLANQASMLSGGYSWDLTAYEIMCRTVLINWNAGVEPPFGQDCPEQGTIFRICAHDIEAGIPQDTFLFTSSAPSFINSGPRGQSIYIGYKLYNEGGKTLRDCYFSLWVDPDVGTAADDLVGCDTLNDAFFAYNGDDADGQYGYTSPATGFKIIYGPRVPSTGDSAYFEGDWIPDYKNLGMTAFARYINGIDPDHFTQTYGFMQGLTKTGDPYTYEGDELTYVHSGDPVTGEGDLDHDPDDVRMMASCGPFDFNPDDSQYVLIRMAVAQGTDRLNSITKVRDILSQPFKLNFPGPNGIPSAVPATFEVGQNYPNPFNPTTTIQYAIPEQAHVTVEVFNVLGQRVRLLVNKTQAPGVYNVEWNGTDQGGHEVATGIYFYSVKAGDYSEKKKMVLIR